jgi:Response regulators consisting of a CheY-like receiver domain and a winged-helix DNA-binding domain
MVKRILLIEDDRDYANLIAELLREENYFVDLVHDGASAVRLLKNKYDLIITDIYMQKMEGFQLIEYIRRKGIEAKVLVLSGSTSDADEVKGLKLGIKDYIRKGTSLEVMLQRVEKALQETTVSKQGANIISSTIENLEIDIECFEVKKDDEIIQLSAIEFDILVLFLKSKNKLLSREMIVKEVWRINGKESKMSNRVVDTHIKNIRKKLNLSTIISIRSKGYKWNEI